MPLSTTSERFVGEQPLSEVASRHSFSAEGSTVSIPMLSVIVPIDLDRRPLDLIRKTAYLVTHRDASRLHFVVAHNDRGTLFDKMLTRYLAKRPNVTLVSAPFYPGAVNNSLLRNKAVEASQSETLLLLDADLVPDQDLFLRCAEQVASGTRGFIMLPCLYLSPQGTQRYLRRKDTKETLYRRFLAFERAPFLHIASPSSVMFMKRADYWRVGGFDERFTGHGYEDFDFMLRLGIALGSLDPAPDLLDDIVCRAPLLAAGFRKHLGRMSLPHFLDREFVLHLHHPKAAREDYYQRRAANRAYFMEKHEALANGTYRSSETSLIQEFFTLCEDRSVSARIYSILFDNRPGHVDRVQPLHKKIGRLVSRLIWT